MTRMRTVRTVGMIAPLALAAIGSSPITASTTPPTSEPATSEAATSDVAAAATPVSSGPDPASSTTPDPNAESEAAVQAAADAAWSAREDALRAPNDPAVLATLDGLFIPGRPARADVDAWVNHLVANDLIVQDHPSVPGSVTIEQVVLGADPYAGRAAVVVCVVDALDVRQTNGQVVDQPLKVYRAVWELAHRDGTWRLFASNELDTFTGTTTCPPPDTTVAESALVIARVSEIDDLRWGAIVDLDNPDNPTILDSILTTDGGARAGTLEYMQHLRDSGQRVYIDPDLPSDSVIEDIAFTDGPPATRADVQICGLDSTVVFEPVAGSSEPLVVVGDLVVSYRGVLHLVLEGDHWKTDSLEVAQQWDGLACHDE